MESILQQLVCKEEVTTLPRLNFALFSDTVVFKMRHGGVVADIEAFWRWSLAGSN
jgi:hypothetical protein